VRVYIAGPMTGLPEFNTAAFDAAARSLEQLGHAVFNPAEKDRDEYGADVFTGTTGKPWELVDRGVSRRDVLATDLEWIARNADAICLLPGWEKSTGALAEAALGRALGLRWLFAAGDGPVAHPRLMWPDLGPGWAGMAGAPRSPGGNTPPLRGPLPWEAVADYVHPGDDDDRPMIQRGPGVGETGTPAVGVHAEPLPPLTSTGVLDAFYRTHNDLLTQEVRRQTGDEGLTPLEEARARFAAHQDTHEDRVLIAEAAAAPFNAPSLVDPKQDGPVTAEGELHVDLTDEQVKFKWSDRSGALPGPWPTDEHRATSPTGGQKGVKEERHDLIPVGPLRDLARLYGRGAAKYEERNWEKAYPWSQSYAAAQRHLTAFWSGEDTDLEMGVPHVICAAFHCLALAQFIERNPEFDDRALVEREGCE